MSFVHKPQGTVHVVMVKVVLLLCLVGFMDAMFLPSIVRAAGTIKLAMITAKTGKAGASNSISFPAARFAVEEINASGGILGKKVEVLEYDNRSTAQGSAEAGLAAIRDGAVAVVGCNWSSHSLGLANVMQEHEIPMISHMSTNEAVTLVGEYIFRICFTDSFQGQGLARFAWTSLNATTAVVLVDSSRSYSVGLAKVFTEAFTALGGRAVWRHDYQVDTVDYEQVMMVVKEHEPDVIFIPGSFVDVGGFVSSGRDVSVRGRFMSADGVGVKLFEHIGDKAHGILYTSHWNRWVDEPESKGFVERFESRVGLVEDDTQALVFDAFMVLKEAIERAESTEGRAIRDALASMPPHVGVTGTIRFDEHGNPIKPLVINELKFGGRLYLEQVYP